MNEPQTNSPRRRLQELLAIPERLRTDEQWDEINELEISLTTANRASAPVPEQGNRQNTVAPTNHPKPNNGARDKKPFKRTHKRPPKVSAP
ncbi:MAG: hypothetical protein Q8L39_09240 [Burkholderiales bacterium]|nr:hypothetical protein [Burkholderiales bacterium]